MKQSGKPGVWTRTPRTAVVSLLMVVMLFAGAGINHFITQVGTAQDRFSSASNYAIIGETYNVIRERYVLQADFTDEELVWGAASGMIDALGDDNHSRFLNPEEAIDWINSSNNELIGIGISVDLTGDLPVVIYPMKDSPAMKAGIQPGDTIVEIDGVDITEMDPREATDLIAGEAGTDVVLKLIRHGETEPYQVTITREKIEIDPVQYAMLPNNVLWLRLDQFSQDSASRVADGLAWGKDQGMTGVIFDLRGNPGGFVSEAEAIAAQFLPVGTPLYQELDVSGETQTYEVQTPNGLYLEGPLVVLVNENSASASEIVSSAIMESGRAELVGETTVGTGTVLLPFDLSDGSLAVIGIELFLTGAGTDIYKNGVDPTHEVDYSDELNAYPAFPASLSVDEGALEQAAFDALEDPQLHFAFDLLQN